MTPRRMCVACGRVGKRGFMKIGGFWLDRLGEWYQARTLPAFWVCEARLSCMRRLYGGGYSRVSFGEMVDPYLDTAEAMQEHLDRLDRTLAEKERLRLLNLEAGATA